MSTATAHAIDEVARRFSSFRYRLDRNGQAVFDRVMDYARMHTAAADALGWADEFHPFVVCVMMAIETEMAEHEKKLLLVLARLEQLEKEAALRDAVPHLHI